MQFLLFTDLTHQKAEAPTVYQMDDRYSWHSSRLRGSRKNYLRVLERDTTYKDLMDQNKKWKPAPPHIDDGEIDVIISLSKVVFAAISIGLKP